QFLIDDDTLWCLREAIIVRARDRVEYIIQKKVQILAIRQHNKKGHWGRDTINIILIDYIFSLKLDALIMSIIRECTKCKNFG
ncbi:hypothetical protein EDB19DRAFT_1637236, partial [Suillus lakei]